MRIKDIFKVQGLIVLTIAGIGIFVYGNTISSGFIWQDVDLILENPYVRSIKNIPHFFDPHYWLRDLQGVKGLFNPLGSIFFTVGHSLWDFNPLIFHVSNLMIHIFNTILFYFIVYKITGEMFVSFLSAIFFVTHPVHTESVAWIKNIDELMAFSFLFGSMIMWLIAVDRPEGIPNRKNNMWILHGLYTLVFAMALLSKEASIALPIILSTYILSFVPRWRWKRYFYLTIPIFLLAIGFALFWIFLIHSKSFMAIPQLKVSISRTTLFIRTILDCIFLILFPINLNAYHPLKPVLVSGDMGFLIRMAIMLIYITVLILSFRYYRPLFFSLSMTLITLIPVANIYNILGCPLSEERLYLPSAGFCLFLALVARYLYRKKWRGIPLHTSQKFVISFFAILIALYCFKAISRNNIITREIPLWEDAVMKSPDLVKPRVLLAVAYIKKGDLSEAMTQLEKAISIDPMDPEIYFHRGNIFQMKGELREAIASFEEALKLKPDFIRAMTNKAILHARMGDGEKAMALLKRALSFSPHNPHILTNMGVLYGNSGEVDSAIYSFEEALKIDPKNVRIISNLAYAFVQKGDLASAIEKYKEALILEPENCDVLLDLGTAFIKKGLFQEAIERFEKAKRIVPNDPRPYNNLGVLYGKLGRYKDAIQEFLDLLRLQPNNPIAFKNLGRAFLDAKEYENAIKAFSRVIQMEPENGKYYYYLGLAQKGKGDLQEAARSFQKAKTLGFSSDPSVP